MIPISQNMKIKKKKVFQQFWIIAGKVEWMAVVVTLFPSLNPPTDVKKLCLMNFRFLAFVFDCLTCLLTICLAPASSRRMINDCVCLGTAGALFDSSSKGSRNRKEEKEEESLNSR